MTMKPSLADRLRAVVGGSVGPVPRVHYDAGGATASPFEDGASRVRRAAEVLGGVVDERDDGRCIVVDRVYDPDARHGWHRVGEIAAALRLAEEGVTALRRAWPAASTAAGESCSAEGLCAMDLETTGLAGGAGTQAFLVGCARLAGDGIHVRQFLLPGFEGERAQLAALAEWMTDRTHLVTFNGRTFDLPLLEMRFSFHRVAWPWPDVPHLDALHPARRFWRERPEPIGPDPDEASCTLGVLERRLAGVHRVGDVAGFEIPSRFFQFARDGRADGCAARPCGAWRYCSAVPGARGRPRPRGRRCSPRVARRCDGAATRARPWPSTTSTASAIWTAPARSSSRGWRTWGTTASARAPHTASPGSSGS
jgi:uncharacterized protein YprB with RNaseH-like and TPR domain